MTCTECPNKLRRTDIEQGKVRCKVCRTARPRVKVFSEKCRDCGELKLTKRDAMNGTVRCVECRSTHRQKILGGACCVCGNPMLISDIRHGCKTCRDCLAKGLGHERGRRSIRPESRIGLSPNRRQRERETSSGEAWWVTAPRDGFTGEAARRHPMSEPPRGKPNLIPAGWSTL